MELEQIVELIDRVSASELDSFCLEQNGMRLSLKKKQPRKQTDPETQSTLVQQQKQSQSPQSDYCGTVKQILVSNGEMVEYGQPLFIVEEQN